MADKPKGKTAYSKRGRKTAPPKKVSAGKDKLSDAAALLDLQPEQLLNLELPELGALWRLESRARSQEYQNAKEKLLLNLFGEEAFDAPPKVVKPAEAAGETPRDPQEAEPPSSAVSVEEPSAPESFALEQIISRVQGLVQMDCAKPELLKTLDLLNAAQEAKRISILCGDSDELFAKQLLRHPLLGGAPPPSAVNAQIQEIKALLKEGLITEVELANIKNRFLEITNGDALSSDEIKTPDDLVWAGTLARGQREGKEMELQRERERALQAKRDKEAQEHEELVRQAWLRERSKVRVVEAPPGATKEQQSWLKNIQIRGGSKEYTLVCPPWLVGPGPPPGMAMDTVQDCETSFSERINVPLEQKKLLAVATRQGKGERQFLLTHHCGDGVQFHENLQVLPLEDATVIHYGSGFIFMGCAEVTVSSAVHPVHPLAGQAILFCSLNPDDQLAMQETQKLADVLKHATEVNANLDARTKGTITHGCAYCISSFPGEEKNLWKRVIYATSTEIARTFDDDDIEDEAISLGCSWETPEQLQSTQLEDQFWWPKWKSDQIRAYLDGQKLLVYSRRDWKNRVEEADVVVSAEDNYSWPGKPINLKKGEPVAEYGMGQLREKTWLDHMVAEGEEWEDPETKVEQFVLFDADRIECRPIETLDEIRAVSKSGEIYRGSYNVAGQPHGFGRMEMANGEVYEGEYMNGVIEGKGKYTYEDGDVYEGDWKDGLKHGQGVATYDDGSMYKGDYLADLKHGFGTYTYANGNVYKGGWVTGNQEGRGEYKWKDGTTFTGTYVAGVKEGMGLYQDPTNGESYTGEYKDGNKHGLGTYVYENGNIYNGDWSNGQSHGEGTFTWKEGHTFVGQYEQGQKHGIGVYTDVSGIWERSVYENGEEVMLLEDGNKNTVPTGITVEEKAQQLQREHEQKLARLIDAKNAAHKEVAMAKATLASARSKSDLKAAEEALAEAEAAAEPTVLAHDVEMQRQQQQQALVDPSAVVGGELSNDKDQAAAADIAKHEHEGVIHTRTRDSTDCGDSGAELGPRQPALPPKLKVTTEKDEGSAHDEGAGKSHATSRKKKAGGAGGCCAAKPAPSPRGGMRKNP